MITTRGLIKAYGAPHVLRGVDLDVARGQIAGIVGPNGAGKTTLLEILATVILPDGGSAAIGGLDVVSDAAEIRRIVAYCPSAPALYPQLTGWQNLEFFGALHGLAAPAARGAIQEALALVGLDRDAAVQVQRYSDGMRQRLSLARALMNRPRVLLLDEPTRSLDPAAAREIRTHLRRLADALGTTILLVTHNDTEAAAVCDRVALLDGGVISKFGTPGEVIGEAAWNAS